MANSILDQTTLEESFFFCEYAKRRFEMSNYNNGEIERAIDIVGLILESHYKENYNIPFPMKMDFLSEVISFCEAINKNCQTNLGVVLLRLEDLHLNILQVKLFNQ